MPELPAQYKPHEVEEKWYPIWEDKGFFNWQKNLAHHGSDDSSFNNELAKKLNQSGQAFSIVIPPPNVTGSLHLGHALNHTIQDILTRYHRMKKDLTLWLPGTDHAGIATQNVVERLLAKDNIKRWHMSREEFEKRVWQWKEESGGMITHQQRQLGESVDWRYERFTMDDGLSALVRKAFVQLYNEKLIYQGERIINWCPRCTTALSNIEVEHKTRNGKLYFFKYPLKDTNEHLLIATTRPETMLGDEAVAIHPEDERYKNLKATSVVLPLVEKEIPIIKDDFVDKEFGTGAVKITPSHDPNDFEAGRRHNLPLNRILDDNARINENGGAYEGLSREEARKKIVADLEEKGLVEKIEDHKHNVGECYRCHSVVEPLASKQWFVNVKPLAEKAIEVVKDGSIQFFPKRWQNVYFDWMYNIQDWCISRQLWWGHRIPAWYCDDCDEVIVSEKDANECPKCQSKNIRQDEDVLDTWFSSGLWPFSTLMKNETDLPENGWPEDTVELSAFYPNSVLVTGFDIIFFWVARMIMMGTHFRKQIPFNKVIIHGLVRDATRQKMSKSKGNVVNPLEKMDEYGTDAFRFFMVSILPEGKDIIYDESRLKGYSAFCNKVFNTARFIWMNQPDDYTLAESIPNNLSKIDQWLLTEFNSYLAKINDALDNFRFSEYSTLVYDFIWKVFCDNFIEFAKVSLQKEELKEGTLYVMNRIFQDALKLLHPVMPFITEELYSYWPRRSENDLIMVSDWPTPIEFNQNGGYSDTEKLLHVIYKVRYLRGELSLKPKEKYGLQLAIQDQQVAQTIKTQEEYVGKLANISSIELIDEGQQGKGVKTVLDFGKLYLDAGDIDIAAEQKRLNKEKENINKALGGLEARLQNKKFVSNAPEDVIAQEKARLAQMQEKIKSIDEILQSLG